MTAAEELQRTDGARYALCTMCVGVGQGSANILGEMLTPVQAATMSESALAKCGMTSSAKYWIELIALVRVGAEIDIHAMIRSTPISS